MSVVPKHAIATFIKKWVFVSFGWVRALRHIQSGIPNILTTKYILSQITEGNCVQVWVHSGSETWLNQNTHTHTLLQCFVTSSRCSKTSRTWRRALHLCVNDICSSGVPSSILSLKGLKRYWEIFFSFVNVAPTFLFTVSLWDNQRKWWGGLIKQRKACWEANACLMSWCRARQSHSADWWPVWRGTGESDAASWALQLTQRLQLSLWGALETPWLSKLLHHSKHWGQYTIVLGAAV